jgi:hypothetical protein
MDVMTMGECPIAGGRGMVEENPCTAIDHMPRSL